MVKEKVKEKVRLGGALTFMFVPFIINSSVSTTHCAILGKLLKLTVPQYSLTRV